MKAEQEILNLEKMLLQLENLNASFDYLKIRIASPQRIQSWAERSLPTGTSFGQILRPETVNFRTQEPELYGLFCERIFGPINDWECQCGKYNGFILDKICEECLVELTESRVRRYRMGYIELFSPVTHIWYLKGAPNYLLTLLQIYDEEFCELATDEKLKPSSLEQIVYCKETMEANSLTQLFGEEEIERNNELLKYNAQSSYLAMNTEEEEEEDGFNSASDDLEPSSTSFYPRVKCYLSPSTRKGSEIIKAALENLNIKQQINKDRSLLGELMSGKEIEYKRDPSQIVRRIRILESFLASETNPSWMVLTNVPVLPPTLRPLVELENGRLIAADVNELYRLILSRNQRLGDFQYRYETPEMIIAQMRRLLQEGVDALIDNARLPKSKIISINNKELKSLTHILEGKQGRFRQSLLGKRVDYSGRSVIIVGPNLRLNECGLPYEMALELFHPFLVNELIKLETKNVSQSTKLANFILRANKPLIWSILEKLTRKYCILLNRAPTLHRFGVQAFNPIIILGQAIHLHPLACTGFNADFDGDQMAVHLPLYESSQLEVSTMMRPSFNLLSPSNGEVILKPTQDMVIGCYYLTLMTTQSNPMLHKWFPNEADALIAYYQKKLSLHTRILVRYSFSNLQVKIHDFELIVINKNIFFNKTPIYLYKIFEQKNKIAKHFLITNIGVFIAHLKTGSFFYEISDFLLETTPGRIIFSQNLKKLRNITSC